MNKQNQATTQNDATQATKRDRNRTFDGDAVEQNITRLHERERP